MILYLEGDLIQPSKMQRFFRKFRQRLFPDNKVGKYLLYAVGEIVLVVIGILIALQINEWNQKIEQQQTVRRYLSNLIGDIKQDVSQYDQESESVIFRYHSLQQLLVLLGEEPVKLQLGESIKPLSAQNRIWSRPLPDQPDSLFIARAFLWSIRDAHPVISKSTYNEMTSTGNYSFLKNQFLKDAINNYYNELEWRFSDTQDLWTLHIMENWRNSLTKSGVLPQDPFSVEQPLDLLRNNQERIGLLRTLIRSAWYRAVSLNRMHGESLNLIQLIETELEK